MMFNEINDSFLGLEWEPSHQIDQFIDPIEQLKKRKHKVIHIHEKDCHIDKEKLAAVGDISCIEYSTHRFPGLGDTDWNEIINIMNEKRYSGVITIEGYHDPVYKDDKEIEGQVKCFIIFEKMPRLSK
jgi:sugar phosphate isomerase/epimerase